jgi:hypothetical protein
MLLSLACLLGGFAGGSAEGEGAPARPSYFVELIIHQGPDGSVLSRPALYLLEGQVGRVFVGQEVRLWGQDSRAVGVRAEAKVVPGGEGLLRLWVKIEHSEVVRAADGGSPQISTTATELETAVRPGATEHVRPADVNDKTLWVEIRVVPATR